MMEEKEGFYYYLLAQAALASYGTCKQEKKEGALMCSPMHTH